MVGDDRAWLWLDPLGDGLAAAECFPGDVLQAALRKLVRGAACLVNLPVEEDCSVGVACPELDDGGVVEAPVDGPVAGPFLGWVESVDDVDRLVPAVEHETVGGHP